MSIPQHSDAQPSFVSPFELMNAARIVLHGIDCDPASDAVANKVVQARRFIAPPEDGLELPWHRPGHHGKGTVWVNPPGGCLVRRDDRWIKAKRGSSSASVWWARFARGYMSGEFEAGIFLGFTLEILARSQQWDSVPSALRFPFCIPKERIKFLDPETLEPQGDPTHSNVLIYAGHEPKVFEAAFSTFGDVILPVRG